VSDFHDAHASNEHKHTPHTNTHPHRHTHALTSPWEHPPRPSLQPLLAQLELL